MTTQERVRYEMLSRVHDFGIAHKERFPESSSAGQAFAIVAKAIEAIDTHAVSKLMSVREGRREQAARRKIIRSRMRAIARTSRGVRTASGAVLGLQMPRRMSDVAVLAAARAFVSEGEAHQTQLEALGLRANCLSELRTAADDLGAALAERRAGRTGVAIAQAGIRDALGLGLNAARTLDIVMANAFESDPVTFAGWQRARRVVLGKGPASSEDLTTQPATAPVASDAA